VLRLFGSEADGVTGGWRKLQIEEFHNLLSAPNISRPVRLRRNWGGGGA
jgi:hypothetical protein